MISIHKKIDSNLKIYFDGDNLLFIRKKKSLVFKETSFID